METIVFKSENNKKLEKGVQKDNCWKTDNINELKWFYYNCIGLK